MEPTTCDGTDHAAYPPVPGEPAAPLAVTPGGLGGATKSLGTILQATFFINLHVAALERMGDGKRHAFRAWLCFAVDLLLRLVVLVLLIAIALAVAWKTLAPLPHGW